MNEHFLHFVWGNGLFDKTGLITESGNSVEILYPGRYNRDSGPDFLDARIKIDNTEWAGNVEIHLDSAMWYNHRHHLDRSYNNVILHVVSRFNKECFTMAGAKIETFVIKPYTGVCARYKEYMNKPDPLVCSSDLKDIDPFLFRHWISSLAVSRIQMRNRQFASLLEETNNDWEGSLYILLAGNMGMKVNRACFISLAKRVPLKMLWKHSDNLIQAEALLFGQAGMLDNNICSGITGDEYYDLLVREYSILRSKYKLKPISPWEWKFHRMRPSNFPTIRISQLAALLSKGALFSRILDASSIKDVYSILRVSSSPYWHTHYRFGTETERVASSMGRIMLNNIIINTIIPFLFYYGRSTGRNDLCDRSVDFLDDLPPENNRVTREWGRAGINPVSALETQGLIELRNAYCKNRRCLNCHIGTKLISLGKEIDPDSKMILGEPA